MKTNVSVPGVAGVAALVVAALALAACGREGASSPVATAAAAEDPGKLVVYEGPQCSCCAKWGQEMSAAGFEVEAHKTEHMTHMKSAVGVPPQVASCHTAKVGGYFVEGHVPAREVQRLLAERPAGRGLVVAGMPVGSPGMELPDGRIQPYEVLLVAEDGSASVYARYPQ